MILIADKSSCVFKDTEILSIFKNTAAVIFVKLKQTFKR